MTYKLKKLIAERIARNRMRLWEWQMGLATKTPPPFYCSVDLRDSGYKIAPVDSNLYPAGFNNICPEDIRHASPVFRAQIEALVSRLGKSIPEKILILPEAHTHNAYYIENLVILSEIITNAGFETIIGWYDESAMQHENTQPVALRSESGKELKAYPINIANEKLMAADFVPDLVLLTNDFSSGYPAALDKVSQPIVPSHRLGWHSRKKSGHFSHYNKLAAEFCAVLDLDPWILQIDSEEVSPVNFNEEKGLDRVIEATERVLDRMKKAYAERNIKTKPFAFIKNNTGTYGIGIMVVYSGDELKQTNSRIRNKMSIGKNRLPIDSVIVQEGIPTATMVNRLAAEPVIYLCGCELVGGFLRTHAKKGIDENLNSPGMVFRKLCMSDLFSPDNYDSTQEIPPDTDQNTEPVLELVYGSIARVSALATGMELTR